MNQTKDNYASEPFPQTELGQVRDAMDDARDICSRVLSLAETLLGPEPKPPTAPGLKEAPNCSGVLPRLAHEANITRQHLGDAREALNRIDRAVNGL